MRKVAILVAAAAVALLAGCSGGPPMTGEVAQPDHPFPVLDAYGVWIDYPLLGRVWQPRVVYDWRPFTEGQWIWTDRGWFWDSAEPFGWIVYHYGFWTYEGAAGWLWVPGYDWSPARVRWYDDETMIGWAPLPPAGVDVLGSEIGWITIQPQYFVRDNVGRYAVRGKQPPAARRPGDERRQPDVTTIERAAARRIERATTESETVRSGTKQVQRVRVGGRTPEVGAPAPAVGGTGTRPKNAEKTQEKPPVVQPDKGGRSGDRTPEPKKDTEKTVNKPSVVPPDRGERAGDRAPEPRKDTEKAKKNPTPEEKKNPAPEEK